MKLKIIASFILLVVVTIGLSIASNRLWGGKPESQPARPEIIAITVSTTLAEAANAYSLNPKALKRPFGLRSPDDLNKTIGELGMSVPAAQEKLRKAKVLAGEESSKNWFKIPLKFALWLTFLVFAFKLLRQGAITPVVRKRMLMAAVLLFGVIMGADPSPMGTIKDAIVLWGTEHVIFPPRLVAFGVFILSVVFANKFICSWGCQFGVLQDLIFRLNRNASDTQGIMRQWKLPFVLTNYIRVAFFAALCVFALIMSTDIVAPIDPFGFFKPMKLGLVGGLFTALILLLSLFVYRPWCHMLCPFGLIGWVFEKISVNKIRVNHTTCISCNACANACPTTVMNAILKKDRVIPDCFSCGTCQGVCPTSSIAFCRTAKTTPPVEEIPSLTKEG